jgi:signal transduction histidine kinase
VIRRLKRLNDRDWRLLDRVLTGLVIVAISVDVLTKTHLHGPLALNLLGADLMGLSLLWRRRQALVPAAALAAGAAVLLAVLTSPNDISSILLVVILAAYSAGAHLELRPALLGLTLVAGAVSAVCLVSTPNDVIFPVSFFAILPWAIGRVIRNQTQLARELTEKAEREEHAREEEEARATASERARVARELHDVLAHNLTVMVIQAAAARRVLERDPEAAADAARLIGRTGREAMTELRHVFGPVHKEDGHALGSAPGLAQLDHLASRAHRAGLPVELRVEGTPFDLQPGADMAAYRVVQEALTNTLKHARGARATVIVRYEPGDVVLEVLDDGAGPAGSNGAGLESGGHGLVGMRERVALYGGRLEAGRRPDGGFSVRARLPVTGALA